MRRPEIAQIVEDGLRFFQGERYDLRAWAVMPNHVHVVMRPYDVNEVVNLLKETPYLRLGGRAFLGLWEDQSLIPEDWKKPFTFVFFDGLILRHTNGHRYSLYLCWHDDQWRWYSASAASRPGVAGGPAAFVPLRP